MVSSASPLKANSPLPMIPVPQALETVLKETSRALWLKRGKTSSAPSSHQQLLGRVSALDVKAPSPGYPNHNSSIMDGYAVKTSDLTTARKKYDEMDEAHKEKYRLDFVIVGRVYAGDHDGDVSDERNDSSWSDSNHRKAAYVTTGAVVPDCFDAVIPIEDTEYLPQNGENLPKMQIIPSQVESVLRFTTPSTWMRRIGCDIPPESVVLSRGETIQPMHMALLAQVGIGVDEVSLKRLPRVGVVSTGNELFTTYDASSGATRQSQGMIPDVNRPLLLSQLSTYGSCIPIDLGIVTDDDGFETIANRLNNVLWDEKEGIDVLISTGGISMGEKDIMERVFVEGMGGNVHFGRLDMKPGKPTTFITIDRDSTEWQSRKLVFALPGNPVSASVCTELLVRPCLHLLHHGVELSPRSSQETFVENGVRNARVHEELMATITSDIVLDQGRPEYRRVFLNRILYKGCDQHHYTYTASDTGVQRSSRVLSLRGAEGLMVLPRGGSSGCGYDIARKGTEFPVLLYSSSSMSSETRFEDSMHRGLWEPEQHPRFRQKLELGVIIVCSSDAAVNDFQSIFTTLITSLGGENKASVVQRLVCRIDDVFAQKLHATISGPPMENVDIIFVIIPADPRAKNKDSGLISFKSGLEVANILCPILSKNAHAMALQVRKSAASQDPLAALFENVVGTVRENSCVLIACSDRGLEGAAVAIKGLLPHVLGTLKV